MSNLPSVQTWSKDLLDSFPAAAYVFEPHTNIFKTTNIFLIKLLGYQQDDFKSHSLDLTGFFVDDENKVKWLAAIQKVQQQPSSDFIQVQYSLKHKNGNEIHVQDQLSVCNCEEGLQILGCIQDISLQKQLQLELEVEKQKAAESSKFASLGQMAAGIAHEINNPLAIIVGRAQQIKKELEHADVHKEKILDLVFRIQDTVERISKIIRGLKSFSRSGENDPMALVGIKTLIEDTLSFCRERFYKNEIDLRLVLPEEFQLECRAVPLSQVLLNLLNNAFDAIQHQELKWIELKVIRQNQKVVISVADSGSGIPKRVVEKIMQPFFTTKEVGKGTGLGLSIALGIIKDHHGQLYVDSAHPNTCFVIEIPLAQN
jgi:C4-dicarboxylate-specific signal transduction histidine kinase